MRILRDAMAAVAASNLSSRAERTGFRLLTLCDLQTGQINMEWDELLDVCELQSRSGARRHLAELGRAGIIHYSTNEFIYVTFLKWMDEKPGDNSVIETAEGERARNSHPHVRNSHSAHETRTPTCETRTPTCETRTDDLDDDDDDDYIRIWSSEYGALSPAGRKQLQEAIAASTETTFEEVLERMSIYKVENPLAYMIGSLKKAERETSRSGKTGSIYIPDEYESFIIH